MQTLKPLAEGLHVSIGLRWLDLHCCKSVLDPLQLVVKGKDLSHIKALCLAAKWALSCCQTHERQSQDIVDVSLAAKQAAAPVPHSCGLLHMHERFPDLTLESRALMMLTRGSAKLTVNVNNGNPILQMVLVL